MSVEKKNPNISLLVSDMSDNLISNNNNNNSNETQLESIYGDYSSHNEKKWFLQTEYIIFRSELQSIRQNNLVVLKECKENKRLLDLKYNDLNNMVNNIQTSVIFCSTISGFLQATRVQFQIPDEIVSVISIFISTYISLLLSISKYYKLDETKEKIQTLRERFSLLHNQLDYRMDVIGPWYNKNIWKHQDPKQKLSEWAKLCSTLHTEYQEIIETKKNLVTEFEIIMDTKSRNKYHILNRELNFANRQMLYSWDQKEQQLEKNNSGFKKRPSTIVLQHEELDNWADLDNNDDEI